MRGQMENITTNLIYILSFCLNGNVSFLLLQWEKTTVAHARHPAVCIGNCNGLQRLDLRFKTNIYTYLKSVYLIPMLLQIPNYI